MENRRNTLLELVVWAIVVVGLYIAQLYHYILFHSLVEIFSIVVATSIFIVAWNCRRFLENKYLVFLGIAFLFVAFMDAIHMLAYRGMNVFAGYGTNLSIQLWVQARLIHAAGLLLAPLFIRRRLRVLYGFAGFFATTTLLLLSVFMWDVFPVCYVDGVGLTTFKIACEYVICLILAGAGGLLLRHRGAFEPRVMRLLLASIAMTIVSELAFTTYVSVYGFSNMVGHYLKLIAYYLIYKALIETGLMRPFDLLFRDLKQSEETLKRARDELEIRVCERTAELARANEELRREIAERLRAEAEVRRLNEELEERVRLRTAELESANKELEAFAYSVSHDLRGPLTNISGYCRLLEEDYGKQMDDVFREYLQRIEGAAERMGQIIEDLLKLSRVTRSQMKRETVHLSDLVREIAAELKMREPQRNVAFTIAEDVVVQGDMRLLRVALENLLSNAWKFTRAVPHAQITFGVMARDGKPVYFIRDNGAGFDMKYAHNLFVPFQRLHSASEFPGSGIGLATVRRIIDRHGGKVWAEGEVGKGATFYFTL
ncbi:MAG: ATP-binding protein [Candidatus Sumerlaeia bacterium]|nr:ATP-binding protein [Candidatus Sumerlaeia bacterium]